MKLLITTLGLLSLSASISFASAPEDGSTAALLQLAASQPAKAIKALEAQLQQQPDWHRGRLELARLYYRNGQYPEARRTVRDVVKRTTLPPQVQKNVLAFYQQILAAEKRSRKAPQPAAPRMLMNGIVSVARGYDGNANGGPEDQDIGVSNVILRRDALKSSDHYSAAEIQLQSRYRLTADILSPRTPGYMSWNNRLGFYKRLYDDYTSADLSQLKLSSEVTRSLTPHWQLGAEVSATHLNYGNETDINYAGIEPFAIWQQGRHRVRLDAEFKHRNYLHYKAARKDGWQNSFNARYSYQINSNWRLLAGLKLLDNDYESGLYSYEATEAEARVQYRANQKLSLQLMLRQRHSQYDSPEAPFYNDARDERYTTLKLGIGYRITPQLEIQANLSGYDNSANHKLHEYERELAELRLSWRFQGVK